MGPVRDDSVLNLLDELQQLEAARLRDETRRRTEAERERLARIEAVRQENQRSLEARIRQRQEAEAAERLAREQAAEVAETERRRREVALRAEAEAALEAARAEQLRSHALAMAELASRSRRGVSTGTMAALLVGALGLAGVGAWLGVYRPAVQADGARLRDYETRSRLARQEARQLEDRLATLPRTPIAAPAAAVPNGVPALPTPAGVVAHPTHPAHPAHLPRGDHGRVSTDAQHENNRGIEIDLDHGPDPMAVDDLPRQPARGR